MIYKRTLLRHIYITAPLSGSNAHSAPFLLHSTPLASYEYDVYAQTHTVRLFCFVLWRYVPTQSMASTFTSFLDRTQRCTTVGRTLPDKISARRRVLYLIIHDSQNRHPCLQRVSNPQSQQVSGRRPTSYNARPLETTSKLTAQIEHTVILWDDPCNYSSSLKLIVNNTVRVIRCFCLFVCFPGVTTHCGCIFTAR
jgi:hypothetical protein